VAGIDRRLGYLPRGWRGDDLLPFERKLGDLRAAIVEGREPPRLRVVTLEEWALPWLERIEAQASLGRLSPLTYRQYESSWRVHLRAAMGRLPLPAISQQVLARYSSDKRQQGLSEQTVVNSLIPLCGMLTDAVAEGLIDRNPLRTPRRARHRGGSRHAGVDLRLTRKAPRFLEPEEAQRLFWAAASEHREIVLCLLTTGLRRCELLGLRWEWIDFKADVIDLAGQLYWPHKSEPAQGPQVRRCKYDSERQLPMLPALADSLRRRQQEAGWVFTDPRSTDPRSGQPWRPEQAAHLVLEPAYDRSGLRRSGQMFHPLRHTYASVLAAGGVRRHQIEELMGHVGTGTVNIYTHLFRDGYETVLAALNDVFGRCRVRV
jgi:integrase